MLKRIYESLRRLYIACLYTIVAVLLIVFPLGIVAAVFGFYSDWVLVAALLTEFTLLFCGMTLGFVLERMRSRVGLPARLHTPRYDTRL